ncbi:MAG: shikimate dehydrogenase [Patescibacteria group bacterium]
MKKYGLLAHPTKYSLSPKMWNAAFESLGMDCVYETADVLPENLNTELQELKTNFSGLSVSMPYKETIIPLLDSISEDAAKIKAVNTVKIENGQAHGFNTDWIGVHQALGQIPELSQKTVLINGTGGATRAAIFALNKFGIIPFVHGRSKEKVEILAADFKIKTADSLSIPNINIFINGTSIGLEKDEKYPIEDAVLKNFEWVFDVVYGETELLRRAKSFEVKTINGFEMVLYQGFEQFRILTGVEAPKEVMRTAIYS